MKKKPTPYLDLYKQCLVDMPSCGLCDTFKKVGLPMPEEVTPINKFKLYGQGLNGFAWASGSCEADWFEFTPLRQNILLLCAALNNEL